MSTISTSAITALGPRSAKDRGFGLFAFVAGLLAALLLAARGGMATFSFNTTNAAVTVPDLVVGVTPTVLALGLLAAALGAAQAVRGSRGHELRWLGGTTLLLLGAFLTWAAADVTLFVMSLLTTALKSATPIALGALAGVIGEKSGIVNIAIEGQLLVAAMAAALVSGVAGPWVGLGVGMAAALALGLLLAVFSIRYQADQIIVGVVLVVFASGLTGFLVGQLPRELNSSQRFKAIAVPGLSDIPVVGPLFFRQTVIVYLMLAGVAFTAWLLYQTRWGLRVRAVGERPAAADTVGINVARMRYQAVAVGALFAGIGGAYYTLDSSNQFSRDMTAGTGFIALAAVLVGRHHPVGALFAALIFGFARALGTSLSIMGVPIDSNVLATTPYVVTILIVAGVIGRVRVPAAVGQPYIKQ